MIDPLASGQPWVIGARGLGRTRGWGSISGAWACVRGASPPRSELVALHLPFAPNSEVALLRVDATLVPVQRHLVFYICRWVKLGWVASVRYGVRQGARGVNWLGHQRGQLARALLSDPPHAGRYVSRVTETGYRRRLNIASL